MPVLFRLPGRRCRAAAWACLVALVAATAGGAVAAKPRPIALSDCRLPHPLGEGSVPARCGTLEVPEDPGDPGGPTLTLSLAVAPAVDGRHAKEPLVIVAGGPGQSAKDFYAATAPAFAPIRQHRDLVLIDQRGTGGSNRLQCDFPDDFELSMPSPARIRELSAECRRLLPGRPEFYTTSIAVQDLEAVRRALGYERISLYGVSYGTRVVQHYLRRYGQAARAVVLDGVLAPDRALGPETPIDAERALRLTFARCAHDPACAGAFPRLPERFEELRVALARHPVHVSLADPSSGEARSVEFDEQQFVGAVRLLNYSSLSTALLPLYIDRAAKGDYVPLAAQLLMLTAHLDREVAYGMNAAVVCSEDVPAGAHVDRAALARTYLGTSQLDGLEALCSGWPPGRVDPDLFAPLASQVPALMLSGEADPVTPPASAARAAEGFRDVLQVVVAGQGHGQIGLPCAGRLIAKFLDLGTARGLDPGCLAKALPVPFVIDFSGPAP